MGPGKNSIHSRASLAPNGVPLQSGSCAFAGKFQKTGPDATKVMLGADAPTIDRIKRVRLQLSGGDAWAVMQAANASRCLNRIYLPTDPLDPFRLPTTPFGSGSFNTSQKSVRKEFRGKRERVVLMNKQKINMQFTAGSFDGGTLTLNTKITMFLVGSRGR